MATVPPEGYVLVIPGPVLQAAREWSQTFLGARFRVQAAIALRLAQENLTRAPLEWGDPLRHLSGNVVECHRPCYPFHFTYRVDVTHRVVVVGRILPIPEAPGQSDL
jgi:hypothetical protein